MNSLVNNMSLDDLRFFLDRRLSEYNVYQFTFVSITQDIELVLPDIIQLSHKFSSCQMIQEIGVDFAHVTFVSHVECWFFYRYLKRVVEIACNRQHVPLFNII